MMNNRRKTILLSSLAALSAMPIEYHIQKEVPRRTAHRRGNDLKSSFARDFERKAIAEAKRKRRMERNRKLVETPNE
jgi:hypothetical protein